MSTFSPDSPSSREALPRPETNLGIRVEVNGQPHALELRSSVAKLLEVLELGQKRVAVAVNRSVVVRSRYHEIELGDGDRIEILEAVGGG